MRANVELGSRDGVFPGVELVHVHNRGVAFGFFADGGLVLVVVGAASVGALDLGQSFAAAILSDELDWHAVIG